MFLVTFGEAMIRLSPPDNRRLEQTASLDVTVGGAEWNVAIGCSRLGLKSRWVSAVPENAFGKMMCNKAREHGVDTSFVQNVKGTRAGIYFVEFGSSPRPSKVMYDRKESAISKVKPGDIDWENAFQNASWFHTSGITPALSRGCAEVTEQAIKTAKSMGLFVSYDLNYRANLWSPEEANAATARYISLVDMCIGNEEDAEKVLGVKPRRSKGDYSKIDNESYALVAKDLVERYGFKYVATSLRESVSVLRNDWSGMLYAGDKAYFSKKYSLEITDRVGGGDAFSAGLIYGFEQKKPYQDTVDFATAFSALKHTIPSDINWATADDVALLLNEGGTRIQR